MKRNVKLRFGGSVSLLSGKWALRLIPVLGLLFSASTLRAADDLGGVTFNPGVRYSQWAINSRLNDFKESTNNCGFDLYDKDGKRLKAAAKWTKVDNGLTKRFHYVPGLVAKAVLESADFYEGFDWSKSWFYSAQAYAEEVTYANSTTAPTLDAMNAVKMYFPILSSSLKSSNVTSKANTAISKLASDIKNYNDNFSIGSNSSSLKEANANTQQKGMLGGWYHKSTGYVDQMWLDGAYMGSATLAQLAEYYNGSTNIFGSTTADWDMVTKQLNIVWNYCWDSNKQLMYHAFSATGKAKAQDSGTATWAGLSTTKPVYHSAAFWGRANAWYFFALVDALEAMKSCNQESTENYKTLKSHLDAFAAGILKWQDTNTGGWFQVMDQDDNYTASSYSGETWKSPYNNYIETSASSIFAAAMFKAVRLGLLGDTYKTAAKKAFEGIVNNFVSQNPNDGTINIWSSSLSAGLGGKSYRDGSNEYYILGKDTKRVLNADNYTEGKVLGGFIMAATEYERAYQNQDSKQILFAKDLAPKYDFSTTAGSLDATAYGNGTITYQWYKDNGTAVANATSATFSPKESGSYYCTASDGKNTIKTRTTTVTAATEGGDNNSGETTTGTVLLSYTVPTSGSASTNDVETTGGKIAYQKSSSFSTDGYKIDNDTKYIKVALTGNTLQTGDIITVTINPKGAKDIVAKNESGKSLTLNNVSSDKSAITYTVTSDDILNGQSVFYLYRNTSSVYVKAIKITRAGGTVTPTTQKYTVTATAGEGGTVAIKKGSDETVASGTLVEENTSLTFTATANDGYEFVNWTDGNGTEVSKASTYTTKVSAAINIKANFKKKEVTPSTGSASVTFAQYVLDKLDSNPSKSEVTTQTIGEITITALGINGGTGRGIKMSKSDGSSFKITAANGAKIKKVIITQDREDRTLIYTPVGTESKNNSVFTYDYSSSLPTEITVSANSEGNIYVSDITVEYESSTPTTPKTDLTAAYTTQNVDAVVGDEDINAPELTVTAGETQLEKGVGYSVSYTSDNENVVKVQEDGTLDAVGKGTAKITATITPADGTKYNNKTLTFTINVSARPLKAVFSTNAVSANLGDEPRVLPKLTVTDVNMQQQVSDYTATYSSSNEGVATVVDGKLNFVGAGKTTIKVTVIPTDENTFARCEASFDVSVADKTPTGPTKESVVYDFTTSVGNTESANANIKVNNGNIMFGTNFKANQSKYITITPNGDGGFKAGDVITLKGKCPKKNSGILIYANLTDAEPQFQSPAFAATEVTYTFTVQKDSPVLYLGRFGGSSTYVTYLNVTRPATSGNKTRLTAAFAKNSDVIINDTKSYTIKLPELKVMDGNDVFKGQYTVVYTSNDEDVATVDGNAKTITIKTPGTVTILATVTPNDANSYEGCTATYTITVKDPTPLVISTMDVMMNATDAKPKQPVIKVYGDDDKLLTLNTDYTLTYSVDNTNVKVDKDGVFSVDGTPYNWTVGTSTVTVTATPTESLGDTYTEGTLDFLYNVVKGKLTPAFMNNFASGVIKIKQYDMQTNNNDKKFRVPLIYNGEDVSEYFKYTYTVKKSDGTIVTSQTTKGNEFTFRPDTEGEFTIEVNAEPKTGNKGQDNYADVYNAPAPMQFNVIVSPDFIRPVITFNPESVQMYVGTTEGAPDVTVTDGTKEIAEGDYNLKWVSFSPSYVKVDEKTGNLEAVSEGQGSVRITVTGDNLESMTAFLSVYVDDPAVYRTKSTEKYGNQRKMWNQDGTMSVTLGGWMFPNNVTGTPYSDEGLSRDYYWANDATLPKWKMTGFDRFVSGEKSKNARQENGSNAMPNTTMVSTADFNKTGTVRDAMFNVPCSGSYLTFNPKTNGTVSVHIFQNGAFDSGVYRPQRRVFVMDEQGNFVQSTPEIENANGKPTGGLKSIGNYKWDINPKGKGTAPAIEDVRSHFKNIPTDFDMTAEKFQNNIYESNLSNDIVPNTAYNENVPGSNGWCVLADSPVTYSFKVKAGKTYYLWNFGSKIGFYGYSFDEDETKPDEISYDENSTNDVKSTEEGHVAKVSINRTFKAGVWSTCVLPFSLNMSQVDAIFGDTYRFGNENGTEILYFDRVDENGKVWFVRHAYNTIVANKPFLIKPTKDVNGINTADCAEYPYVIIEAPEGGKPAAWCAGSGYSWVSGYNNNEMYVGNGDGFIATDGKFMTYTGSPAPLKGFRGYLKKDSGTAAKILSVGVGSNVDSDNTTTLIDNLIIDNDANASQGIGDGKVYNINGQVVGNGKSFNTLPSGVYIINGKKYIK